MPYRKLTRLQRWRQRLTPRARWWTHRHCCLECGFLAYHGGEARQQVRGELRMQGVDGYWPHEPKERPTVWCSKGLWPEEDPDLMSLIAFESNRPRRYCRGFFPWVSNRSPAEHQALEDKRRDFHQQRWLAAFAFLGSLIGAAIGARC